jgi:hypothetical protein
MFSICIKDKRNTTMTTNTSGPKQKKKDTHKKLVPIDKLQPNPNNFDDFGYWGFPTNTSGPKKKKDTHKLLVPIDNLQPNPKIPTNTSGPKKKKDTHKFLVPIDNLQPNPNNLDDLGYWDLDKYLCVECICV